MKLLLIFLFPIFLSAQEVSNLSALEIAWEPSEEADSYELEVKLKGSKKKPQIFKTKETKFQKELPLGKYSLRIRSLSEEGYAGQWSKPLNVDVLPLEMELIEPKNKVKIPAKSAKKQRVRFSWQPKEFARQYVMKIWSKEDRKVSKIRTDRPNTALDLDPLKTYFWQVYVRNKKGVNYESGNKPNRFSIIGKQLDMPIIEKVSGTNPVSMNWKVVLNAHTYDLSLYRRDLLGEDWQLIHQEKAMNGLQWKSEKKLSPGEYRLELRAHAPKYVSSEPRKKTFLIKPTLKELASF